MRCKACGRVVPDGSVRCPHCGAYMSRGGRPGEEFKWNIQEYPKPKGREPADVSVDWQGGTLVDNESGRTYDQRSGSGWKEPEEVKFLFTFEPENEELQKEVDQKVDILAERAPKEPPAAEARGDLFSLPSQMDMKEFDSLLEDDEPAPPPRNAGWINDYLSTNFDGTPIQQAPSGEEPVYRKAPTAAEFIFGTGVKKEEPLLNWDLSSRPSAVKKNANAAAAASAAARMQAQQAAAAAAAAAAKKEKVVPPPERAANGKYSVPKMMQEQQYDPFETRKTWGSMHMPDFLRNGERLLFTSSGPDIYEEVREAASRELGPSAGYKADMEEIRAQETFKRLIDVEERFTEDMDRVVFMSDEEKELEEKAERRREELIDVPRIDFLSLEDEYDRYREVNGIPRAETIEEVLGTEEAAKSEESAGAEATAVPEETPREVNIRINSPSGTKYTVKTQEIHMNTEDAAGGSEAAKAVQVSVEVNGTGSGSVEVTSGPDGATRVTATEEGQEALSEADVLPAAEPEDDVPFWEKKPVTRMTITDIFGPEAREILEGETADEDGQPEDGEAEDLISTLNVAAAAEDAAEAEEAEPEASEATVEEAVEEAAEEAVETAEVEPEAAEESVEEAAEEEAEEPVETAETEPEAAEESVVEAAEEAAEEAVEAEETEPEAAEESVEEAAEEAAEEAEEAAETAETEPEAAEESVEEAAAEAAEEPAAPAAEDPDKTLAEAIAEAAEEPAAAFEEPAEEDFSYYEEPAIQEFTYSVDEDRLTKEEIRNMSQEELDAAAAEAAAREAAKEAEKEEEKEEEKKKAAAAAAAAEGIKSSDKAAETKASADKPDEAKKSKETTEEDEKPAKKKLFGKKDSAEKAAREEEKAAKAEAKARKKAAKAAAARAAKDEDEPMSLRIMRIVIIILIVAVVLEFLIFGIRLLAPDSMLGIIFNKLGSGFSGADSLFGSGIFRM